MRVIAFYGFLAFLVGYCIFQYANRGNNAGHMYTLKMEPFWFYPEIEKELESLSDSTINEVHQKILEKYPDVIDGDDEGNQIILTERDLKTNHLKKWFFIIPSLEEVEAEELELPDTRDPAFIASFREFFRFYDCIFLRLEQHVTQPIWDVVFCKWTPYLKITRLERQKNGDVVEKMEEHKYEIVKANWKFPDYNQSTVHKLFYVEEMFESKENCSAMETSWKANVRYQCNVEQEELVKLLSVTYNSRCEMTLLLGTKSFCKHKHFLRPSQRIIVNILGYPYIPREKLMKFLVARKEKNERNRKISPNSKVPCTIYYGMRRTQHDSGDRKEFKYFKVWEAGVKCATTESEFFEDKSEYAYIFETNYTNSFLPRFDDYVEYETVEDEDRGHFWYYMNSPEWDKSLYPRKLYNVAVIQFVIDDAFLMLGAWKDEDRIFTLFDRAHLLQQLISNNNIENAAIDQRFTIGATHLRILKKNGAALDRVQKGFPKGEYEPIDTLLEDIENRICDFEKPLGKMTKNLTDDFLKGFEVLFDDFIVDQSQLRTHFGRDLLEEYPKVVENYNFDEFREQLHEHMLKFTYSHLESLYTVSREYHVHFYKLKYGSFIGQDKIDDCFAKFHQYIAFRSCELLEQKIRAKLGISDSEVPSYDVDSLASKEIPLLPQNTEMFREYEHDRSIAIKELKGAYVLRFLAMIRQWRKKDFQFHKKWKFPEHRKLLVDLVYKSDYNEDTLLSREAF